MLDKIVSIIIPVYNDELYLDRCISSVINQTYKKIEIIIVNDGSNDNSEKICLKWKKLDERIIYYYQKNSGVTKAREKGILYSSGNWICFVDSDDELPIDSIEILLNNVENNDIVIGHVKHIQNEFKFKWPYKPLDRYLSKEKYIIELLRKKIHSGPCAKLIKKVLFDKNTFSIPKRIVQGEDYLMNLSLCNKISKVKQIKEIVYNYYDDHKYRKMDLSYYKIFLKYEHIAISKSGRFNFIYIIIIYFNYIKKINKYLIKKILKELFNVLLY